MRQSRIINLIYQRVLTSSLFLLIAGCGGSAPQHQPAQGALGPYSGAVLTEDFIFISGKIGERGGEFDREVETAIDAVESELRRAGASLADALSVTVYLTDMQNYARFNEIYAARVPQPYPARAVVGVQALPGGANVQIQVVARKK